MLPQANRPESVLETGQVAVATNTVINAVEAEGGSQSNNKLASYVSTLIADNKSKIIPLLKQKAGNTSLAALQDDASIQRLSEYLYERLPSVVKLAVSVDAFNQFMMNNREKLLAKLLIEEQSTQEISVVSVQDIGSSTVQSETQAIVSVVEAEVIANHPGEGFVASAKTSEHVPPKIRRPKTNYWVMSRLRLSKISQKLFPCSRKNR